jgi:hypothetical protein
VLLLFDFKHRSILKAPFHNVRFFIGILHELALGDGRPAEISLVKFKDKEARFAVQFGEVLKLDVMPHVREWRTNNGALDDAGGGWDGSGSHVSFCWGPCD